MDISRAVATMKGKAGFSGKVGVALVHVDLVRSSPRGDQRVAALEIQPDQDRIEAIREEFLGRPGIFEIVIEAKSGRFHAGDELLFLLVAGDLLENVQPVLAEMFERIRAEAVVKKEIVS